MSSPHLHKFHQDLSKLPRLDKTQFISSYLREQKVHSKSYTLEGRAFLLSWNDNIPPEPTKSPLQKNTMPGPADFGFGTPVLKARTAEPQRPSEITKGTSKESSRKPHNVLEEPIAARGKDNKRKRSNTILSVSKPRQRAVKSKKGKSVVSDDLEEPIATRGKENKRKRPNTGPTNILPVDKFGQRIAKPNKGKTADSDTEQSKRL